MKEQKIKTLYMAQTFHLAWPAIAEQLLLTMATYVDTAMIGSLGANATAAVAINSSTVFLVVGLLSAVGVGFSVQTAHNLGRGNLDAARKVSLQALWGSILFGLLVMTCCLCLSPWLPKLLGADPTILSDAQRYLFFYSLGLPLQSALAVFSAILRCAKDTRTPLLLNTGANLLNVVLNFLLIFPARTITIWGHSVFIWGAGLGVSGAAIATAASVSLAGLCAILILFFRDSPVKLSFSIPLRPDSKILCRALRLGIPVGLERVTISSGQLIMTGLVTSLGNLALAANHVAVTAEGISYLPAQGISFAATALVGQSVGANSPKDSRSFSSAAGWIGLWSGCLGGLFLFFLATPLAQIFSSDPAVIALAADMLRIVAISEPLFSLSIVLSGVLRGLGNTRFPFVVVLMGMWCVRLPLALLLIGRIPTGLAGAWLAMVADLIVRGVLCYLRIRKLDFQAICEKNNC